MRMRSLLFVPGDSDRKFAKAQTSGADVLIFDLEDAVAPSQKDMARGLVAEWLTRADELEPSLFVRVNPLDTVPLRAPLVFLDGDDPAQLAWATRRYASTKAKLILVAGAPLELMKARQRRFYFDQGGTLVKHFGIRAVPATVEQQGRALLITEQPLPPKERAPS